MRILLIHRYFWPDTPPYAAMLRSIGKRLAEGGHEVSILSSQPSYKATAEKERQPSRQHLDGMAVHRIALLPEAGRSVLFRLFNMAYFPLRILLFAIFKGKFDLVMASTAPPVVVGFFAALGTKLRGGSFFYHCMDIHPEIGALSGEFRNPFIFKLLRAMDQFSCNVARRVIVLSNDMKVSLEARPGYEKRNITVINNFSMPFHGEVLPVDSELLKEQGKFRVIFAGNLGRFQGLEVFIDAMKLLKHCPDVELVLLGEGNALPRLKKQAGEMKNIRFLPHQEVSVARGIIRDADLGIVSLSKEIYKYAYPSKTMTYLEEGCPLLVSVEKESELVRFVNDNKIGVCVEPGSTQSIADVIETLYRQKEKHSRMKIVAIAISDEHFSEDSALLKWSSLVDSLGKER